MKEGWSNRWKKLLIWVCGYLSIIAFAIVGGYTIVKSDDKELKKTSHKAFVITVIFTIIEAFLAIYSACLSMANTQTYSGDASDALVWLSAITVIAKTIVFAVFAIIDFCEKGDKIENKQEKSEKLENSENKEKNENSKDENNENDDTFTKSSF